MSVAHHMTTAQFLQYMFPLTGTEDDATEYIRIITFQKDHLPWPGLQKWWTRQEVHAFDVRTPIEEITGHLVDGFDVYFTPHTFTRRDPQVTKEDAGRLTQVAWVECDDDHLDPNVHFSPKPSIIVETSPKRHHVYYLLAEPVPSGDIEILNQRLVGGNKLTKDTGGWALTKLLRLPGTKSQKRVPANEVYIKKESEPERVHGMEAFNDLPQVQNIKRVIASRPMPKDGDGLVTRRALEELFTFPAKLVDLLDNRKKDRSSALFTIYAICARLGMTEEQIFSLVADTANDKFAEHRWHHYEDLWHDVLRGAERVKQPDDTPVQLKIRAVRHASGLKPTERRQAYADIIIQDLSERGQLYYDPRRKEALFYNGTDMIEIETTNTGWKTLLCDLYGIVAGEDDYKPVNTILYTRVVKVGEHIEPRNFAYYDRERHMLYIYNNGGKIYRLDGDTIEMIDNGVDGGITFRKTPNTEPWEIETPSDDCPSLDEAIFGVPNWLDNALTHSDKEARLLARTWLYSLFFAEYMEVRTHLVISGPTNSGKTTLFMLMGQLLNSPRVSVDSIPHTQENFEVGVTNAHHMFFDNVDTPNKWFEDAIAQVATGMQVTRRILYTTNESITYPVHCYLGVTCRDLWFARADVSTRLIVLNVERREMTTNTAIIYDRVRKFRNMHWYNLLHELNRAVKAFKTHVDTQQNIRMAAFANVMEIVCELEGYDHERLLNVVQGAQQDSTLATTPLFQPLELWVHKKNGDGEYLNSGRDVTSKQLYSGLKLIADDLGYREFHRKVPNPQSLAKQLKEIKYDLRHLMDVHFTPGNPQGKWRLTLYETMNQSSEVSE